MSVPDPGKNAELVAAADEFAAAVRRLDEGDAAEQMRLLKQADKLRVLLESPMDTIMKQWELVSYMGTFENLPM